MQEEHDWQESLKATAKEKVRCEEVACKVLSRSSDQQAGQLIPGNRFGLHLVVSHRQKIVLTNQ
jgi:hypothetical protein